MNAVDVTSVLAAMEQAEEQADAALVRSQFGKLTISNVRYFKWVDGGDGSWTTEDVTTYEKGCQTEVTLKVDVKEFNPTWEYDYERRYNIGDPDWRKIFVPSVEAIFGEGSMSRADDDKDENGVTPYATTVQKLFGSYIEAHDVLMLPRKNNKHKTASGTHLRVLKVARVFDSREDCYNARVERFGVPDVSDAVPPDYDSDSWSQMRDVIVEKAVGYLDLTDDLDIITDKLVKEFAVDAAFVKPLVEELIPF